MSRLVSRILLTVFMLPAGTVAYILAFTFIDRRFFREADSFATAGIITWAFVAGYWVVLWRGSVLWNGTRILKTSLWAIGALIAAITVGSTFESITPYSNGSFGCIMGSIVAPLVWLIATVFVWRETATERGQRLSATATGGVVCPTCGYNLTGLIATRCPECGTQFTLDELLARQPGKADAEVEA